MDLSFLDKFSTFVHTQPVVQKWSSELVQSSSKLLPQEPPSQQLGKSCIDLPLAIPAFAHWDCLLFYLEIEQSVDSGSTMESIEKRVEKSSISFLQIQAENHFKSLEITLSVGGMKSATKRVLQRVFVKGIPCCASTGVLCKAASWSA